MNKHKILNKILNKNNKIMKNKYYNHLNDNFFIPALCCAQICQQ